jgi:hypothetical protein
MINPYESNSNFWFFGYIIWGKFFIFLSQWIDVYFKVHYSVLLSMPLTYQLLEAE